MRSTERRCKCRHSPRCEEDCCGSRLAGCLGFLAFFAFFIYPLILFLRWWLRQQRQQVPPPPRFAAPTSPDCQTIPPHIYRRPDPLIYSQQYLQSQGIAVTWQNPDVTIEQGGVPVDPTRLLPSTTYDVVARIWNSSVSAGAVDMPVVFSYLSFGVGTQQHPIGTTQVNLGAKGAPNCPTYATQSWTTPATPGHYCLLVALVWADDANPNNNIGQSNTDVKKLNSPHAAFEFEAANQGNDRQVQRFVVDSYALPQRPSCDDRPPAQHPVPSDTEIRAQAAAARKEHDPAAFPVPEEWTVTVDPAEVELGHGESKTVTVDVTAPDGFDGSKQFNVHSFDAQGRLLGGVTLTVES